MDLTVYCQPCHSLLIAGKEPRTEEDRIAHFVKKEFEEKYPRHEVKQCGYCNVPLVSLNELVSCSPHASLVHPVTGQVGLWLCHHDSSYLRQHGHLPPFSQVAGRKRRNTKSSEEKVADANDRCANCVLRGLNCFGGRPTCDTCPDGFCVWPADERFQERIDKATDFQKKTMTNFDKRIKKLQEELEAEVPKTRSGGYMKGSAARMSAGVSRPSDKIMRKKNATKDLVKSVNENGSSKRVKTKTADGKDEGEELGFVFYDNDNDDDAGDDDDCGDTGTSGADYSASGSILRDRDSNVVQRSRPSRKTRTVSYKDYTLADIENHLERDQEE